MDCVIPKEADPSFKNQLYFERLHSPWSLLGNSLGIVALMYNGIHGAVIKARGDREDLMSAVAAATASGAIFKSTAGIKKCLMGGGVFGSAMLAFQLYQKYEKSKY